MEGTIEYFQNERWEWQEKIEETTSAQAPPPSPVRARHVQRVEGSRGRGRGSLRVRFNTGVGEVEDQTSEGAERGAGTRASPATPPPTFQELVVTQKVPINKMDEFVEQSAGERGGAAAFLVENENIAEIMGNYQFDDDDAGWVQPGLVVRRNDPYWGTGNKGDEYEITVRKVNQTRKRR